MYAQGYPHWTCVSTVWKTDPILAAMCATKVDSSHCWPEPALPLGWLDSPQGTFSKPLAGTVVENPQELWLLGTHISVVRSNDARGVSSRP